MSDVISFTLPGVHVYQIISRYHGSNTFILELPGFFEVLVIDPGDPDVSILVEFLERKNFSIHSVWLTHEHSDHCAGVNALHEWQSFPLYCSTACSANILDSKKNFSVYIDEIKTFTVQVPSTILDPASSVGFHDCEVSLFSSPGHTPGSACFHFKSLLFSGDTLMKEYKTPLNFPGSDKAAYQSSVASIFQEFQADTLVFPGHGSPFQLSEHPLIHSSFIL